jgi:hypothetical protein
VGLLRSADHDALQVTQVRESHAELVLQKREEQARGLAPELLRDAKLPGDFLPDEMMLHLIGRSK